MTEASPRQQSPLALILALLSFIGIIALAGFYIWSQQNAARAQSTMVIDQLRRIDERLGKLENNQVMQDTAVLETKLDQLDQRITEMAPTDNTAIQQQLQTIIDQQNEFLKTQSKHSEAEQQAQQHAGLKSEQEKLLHDLQGLAPSLLTPAAPRNFWEKFTGGMQRWMTVRPQPSAAADISTPAGKISRALYELQNGQVEAALDVLPQDPRLTGFRNNANEYLAKIKPPITAEPAALTPAETATAFGTPEEAPPATEAPVP